MPHVSSFARYDWPADTSRTARPYTRREKAWMIALDRLQALVEIVVLFPGAGCRGCPDNGARRSHSGYIFPCTRLAAIESADHIIEWLNAAPVSEQA